MPPCHGDFFKEFGECNTQPCAEKSFELEHCFHGKGTRYDKSISLNCCEDWDKSPFKHSLEHLKGWKLEKNYCRNVPIDGRFAPWCFVKQTEECMYINYGLNSEVRSTNWK